LLIENDIGEYLIILLEKKENDKVREKGLDYIDRAFRLHFIVINNSILSFNFIMIKNYTLSLTNCLSRSHFYLIHIMTRNFRWNILLSEVDLL